LLCLEGSIRPVYASGDCEIDLARRELRVLGSPVPVGGRAFEVIEVLAQSAGELVTKDELMNRIWPGAIVMENTLHVHAAAVRKALGPYRKLLKTESRRGYRLLGSWTVRRHDAARPPVGLQQIRTSADPTNNFPPAVTRLVGRKEAVQRVRDLVSAYRVVTLTGPGGIGKTSLALKVARRILGDFPDGAWLVELAALSDPDLVPSAVARALGVKLAGETITVEAVARAVGDQNLMLVLDNCEHLIDAAANLAEMLVRWCPSVTILATSREVFRIAGEHVYRVPPLEVPPLEMSALAHAAPNQILDHSAVELFVDRTAALGSDVAPHGESLQAIAAICRHLDGIPLAIEFAAARAAALGIEQVAAGLRDRFALLTSGRRTAVPRHRTLRAALDWSYELLPAPEQLLLRHLAIFPAGFTIDAAAAVMTAVGLDTTSVMGGIANLVAKSLVALDKSDASPRWHLLETTRTYALEKLAAHGEAEQAARRHAAYYRTLLERAETEWDARPTAEMRVDHGRQVDNVRAAIDWAFSPGGDASLGVALTTAAVPLWMHLSLLQECRGRVERAIAALAATAHQDTSQEMKLHAALGASLAWVGGSIAESDAAWARALHLAERLGDVDHQLRALWGLWLRKKSREALPLAWQFFAVASTQTDKLVGDRMIAVSSHYLGDQDTARHHIERVVDNDGTKDGADNIGQRIISFQFDQRLGARSFLARILWVQGFPDQAIQLVHGLVERAKAAGHASSLCHSLAFAACPIALWAGEQELAQHYTDLLRDTSATHALFLWRAFANAYQGVLCIERGDARAGIPLIRSGFDDFGAANTSYRAQFIGALAAALGRVGQVAEGLAAIDEEIDRTEQTEEFWIIAELLRVKGEFLSAHGTPDAAPKVEWCFRQALDWAARQKTRSWALRAATSSARLQLAQGRSDAARQILAPIYDWFTEGFATADLRAARAILDALPLV
jgi:predicted ATPase/DNA-binding winged helix-turn-helix (wHTH) protein